VHWLLFVVAFALDVVGGILLLKAFGEELILESESNQV
jgi:hypothetical protein